MKWRFATLFFLLSLVAAAQSEWKETSMNDPLHNVSFQQFTLEGKFLISPHRSSLSAPVMVLRCQPGEHRATNGHFIDGWIATGAVLDSVVQRNGAVRIPIEYRLDDKKLQSDYWPQSTDHSSVFLTGERFCGDCNLNTLLYGHFLRHKRGKGDPVRKIIIGVPEYLGSQIQMQFDMPDPEHVAESCGAVWKK